MTELVLNYNRDIVPQETGYWCGPASAQVVLNSRGIHMSESQLAKEIGTTTQGTDYVGLIERVLDRVTPEARYTSVEVATYPDAARKEVIWDHVVRSIRAGYGVIMNWVAPPSNYPRGVKGSTSPAYGGGTIYHYVAVMGLDDTPGARALWIADSGFRPFGYWVSFDQACTLLVPKAYCYADLNVAAPAPAPVASTPPVALLSRAMGDTVPLDRYAQLLPAVSKCLRDCRCTTVKRAAMWLAQVGHESAGLKYMAEVWGPTAAQLGYEGRKDLGNTQPGDGYRFRGSGPIQVTGRHNFTLLSRWAYDQGLVPTPTFFVDNPDELRGDRYGFTGVVWYWTTQRPMNDYADAGDISGATRAINGGLTHLAERTERYNRCLAMGSALLDIVNPDQPQDWQPVLDYLKGVIP